jgi:hypothetical protein
VLTEIARAGAQNLLAEMIHQEVKDWLAGRADLRDGQGRQQVDRNGDLPKRSLPGGGQIEGQQSRVRGRRPPEEAERFTSKTQPPLLRKTKSIEELIPWLRLPLLNAHQICHVTRITPRRCRPKS